MHSDTSITWSGWLEMPQTERRQTGNEAVGRSKASYLCVLFWFQHFQPLYFNHILYYHSFMTARVRKILYVLGTIYSEVVSELMIIESTGVIRFISLKSVSRFLWGLTRGSRMLQCLRTSNSVWSNSSLITMLETVKIHIISRVC